MAAAAPTGAAAVLFVDRFEERYFVIIAQRPPNRVAASAQAVFAVGNITSI
jgi:hypothetical protein